MTDALRVKAKLSKISVKFSQLQWNKSSYNQFSTPLSSIVAIVLYYYFD